MRGISFVCNKERCREKCTKGRERTRERQIKRATEISRKGNIGDIEIWKVGKVLQTDCLCEYLG